MLDFEDPVEIGVYVSREFLAMREPALLAGQRVHGGELAGAFASLRANELVWNYVVNNYLKGETPPAFDLLYWNSDSSNLPGPMYVYYLRNLYLDNRLREPGALTMAGERIDLSRVATAYVMRRAIPSCRGVRRTDASAPGGDAIHARPPAAAGVINPPEKSQRNHRSATPVEKADTSSRHSTGKLVAHWGAGSRGTPEQGTSSKVAGIPACPPCSRTGRTCWSPPPHDLIARFRARSSAQVTRGQSCRDRRAPCRVRGARSPRNRQFARALSMDIDGTT
jgi:hypothetical protein